MRTRIVWLLGLPALAAAGFAVLSWGQGQTNSPATPAATHPAPPTPPHDGVRAETTEPRLDPTRLGPLQRQMYESARRGTEWLARANRPDGHFVYGHVPDLNQLLEGDHYLRQAGAAFALARGARFTGDPNQAALARQAVLTLLMDTATDAADRRLRYTNLPSSVINRLGAAGLLVLAVNELPEPGADLLEQSEQLCAYIAHQQRADGSLAYGDTAADTQTEAADPDGVNYYPGEALYALMRSQRHRPAAWKTDVVRKARGYYLPWWRRHKSVALVPWHMAAYAEAYLRTRDPGDADAVNEMADWLCGLQYTQLDERHPLWIGGFMGWGDGKPAVLAPQVGSASCAEGLAEACRVARRAGDLPRYQRYRQALERGLQFLTTLQYTEANTGHFADWYRKRLLGAFYLSHQDGTLRIDYTQHAVCALVQYLLEAAEADRPATPR